VAKKIGAVLHMRVSAQSMDNVPELFQKAMSETLARQAKKRSKK
jgi:hypothetical protein